MKIMSKFKDYYDYVISYGIDPNLTYERMTKEIKLDLNDKSIKNLQKIIKNHSTSSRFSLSTLLTPETIFLGFCGKLYGLIHYPATTLYFDPKISKIFSSIDSFKNHLCNFNKDSFITYYEPNIFTKLSRFDSLSLFLKKYNGIDIETDIFIKLNSPIFLYKNSQLPIIINPKLSDCSFYNIKSSEQTFQELSMFIGGILNRREPDVLNISDDKKLIKNGFDERSFKTITPGKKLSRRNK